MTFPHLSVFASQQLAYCLTAQGRRQVSALTVAVSYVYIQKGDRKETVVQHCRQKEDHRKKKLNEVVHGCSPSKQEVEKENPCKVKDNLG